jgi:hypothetical protein
MDTKEDPGIEPPRRLFRNCLLWRWDGESQYGIGARGSARRGWFVVDSDGEFGEMGDGEVRACYGLSWRYCPITCTASH